MYEMCKQTNERTIKVISYDLMASCNEEYECEGIETFAYYYCLLFGKLHTIL